ncbi:hypothetical protein P3T36_005382 [Kitasatospora sp. MAP12-15]|uniref:hypothetical protein n=1 Tax=unclassified Kitasatospora TaxID=2633591 RepID=UPI00247399A9|nr:hypothetical protein [Kitasatospora sp. MAP12-44]MDH6109817.1 hypothetical protein [Kitasatospora sp. MAP12-44]
MAFVLAVHPERLAAEGRALQGVGRAVAAELAAVHGPSDAAAAGLCGWRSAAALDRLTGAWSRRLSALAVELDDAGGRLVATAGSYRETDGALARSLGRA